MKSRTPTCLAAIFLATVSSSLPLNVFATAVAFQDPGTGAWGNWTRNSAGSVYVHWDIFGNNPNIGVTPVLPDTTPDIASFGTLAAPGAVLLTNKKGSAAQPAAFITGSSNIYSFNDVLAFQVLVQPKAAHTGLGSIPITVALQLSILGANIDDSSVKLLGQTFSSKTVLSTGASSGPAGTGTGVDNDYLYLWRLSAALPVYTFDFAALGTSLSLDAVAIDIGRAPTVVVVPPVPPVTTVPLPAPLLLLCAGLMGICGHRRGA